MADGTGGAERLTTPEGGTSHVPESFSPAGDVFLFDVLEGPSGVSLWTYALRERTATRVEGIHSTTLTNAAFAPDGKWIAWTTSESRPGSGIFIPPFPGTGARYQVCFDRGIYPLWARDGRALFFTPPGQLQMVAITTHPSVVIGNPVSLPRGFLVAGTGTSRSYDLLPDGRFVGVIDPAVTSETGGAASQVLVLHWFEELTRLVPAR